MNIYPSSIYSSSFLPLQYTQSPASTPLVFGMEANCCEKREAGDHYDCQGCQPLFPNQSNTGKPQTNPLGLPQFLLSTIDWFKHLFLGFWLDLKQIFSGSTVS